MTHRHFPELNYLLQQVEQKYSRRIAVPKDYEILAETISQEVGEPISGSTLKRLWGYDDYSSTPSPVTLDILARYAGFRSFPGFCESLKKNPAFVSGFLHSEYVESANLAVGKRLEIGWNPNRLVTLEYLGDSRFRVIESVNATLRKGDEFKAIAFIKGYPLYIPGIHRGGEDTPVYVAGQQSGLTRVAVL